jgi:HlyD family secretion protein
MDIAKPSNARRKRIRRLVLVTAAIVVVGLVALGLSRIQPAAPSVERSSLLIDAVKRTTLVREIRGIGTLVPEDIRWIPATTEGRVEKIVLRPGVRVNAQSVILVLSNPQLEQQFDSATLQVRGAEAQLASLRVQVQNELLGQKALAESVAADYAKAKMNLDVLTILEQKGLIAQVLIDQAKVDSDHLAARDEIARQQATSAEGAIPVRVAVQQADLDRARATLALIVRQRADLVVRAGLNGVLQLVPVDVGQQVASGANVARVADPTLLKAEVRVNETEAQDIQIGQRASIDTRNGIIQGLVSQVDPSVQNGTRTVTVALTGELPKGAVADLTVDGTIELERLPNVLVVGRPASGQERQRVAMFKVAPDGLATRVQVTFGRRSANSIEIADGLREGEQVVLSDMSRWDAVGRLQLR